MAALPEDFLPANVFPADLSESISIAFLQLAQGAPGDPLAAFTSVLLIELGQRIVLNWLRDAGRTLPPSSPDESEAHLQLTDIRGKTVSARVFTRAAREASGDTAFPLEAGSIQGINIFVVFGNTPAQPLFSLENTSIAGWLSDRNLRELGIPRQLPDIRLSQLRPPLELLPFLS